MKSGSDSDSSPLMGAPRSESTAKRARRAQAPSPGRTQVSRSSGPQDTQVPHDPAHHGGCPLTELLATRPGAPRQLRHLIFAHLDFLTLRRLQLNRQLRRHAVHTISAAGGVRAVDVAAGTHLQALKFWLRMVPRFWQREADHTVLLAAGEYDLTGKRFGVLITSAMTLRARDTAAAGVVTVRRDSEGRAAVEVFAEGVVLQRICLRNGAPRNARAILVGADASLELQEGCEMHGMAKVLPGGKARMAATLLQAARIEGEEDGRVTVCASCRREL